MADKYFLMRKNEVVTMVMMDEVGHMRAFSKEGLDEMLAPMQYKCRPEWLIAWWEDRSVPLTQGRIKAYLKEKGYVVPSAYLVKNLGLSLTDYYWIKPADSNLTWKAVNLFDNDFKENLITWGEGKKRDKEDVPHYSPNSSLQGDIEKTWIIMDGKRCLLKGNRTNLSSESINEVIAGEIHRLQGYDNYTTYRLIKIKGRDYDYGCVSLLFTSQKKELIPAYALYTSAKKRNDLSPFRHFMNVCKANGMDTDRLQQDMDYLILTDFIMSEYDRHLNNIGIIRDAKTLKLLRMAPIYDSGGSLFANKAKPKSDKDLLRIETNGFVSREINMLKLVKDRKAIDLTLLPPASYIRKMYAKDTQIPERDINAIAHWYEKKIDMCRSFQLGHNASLKM